MNNLNGLKNLVLVHGAFADGSSWARLIPILQENGYRGIAVQNPLTSLEDDVAATKRAIAAMDWPVLLEAQFSDHVVQGNRSDQRRAFLHGNGIPLRGCRWEHGHGSHHPRVDIRTIRLAGYPIWAFCLFRRRCEGTAYYFANPICFMMD